MLSTYVERLKGELKQLRPLKGHDRPQAQYIRPEAVQSI